MIIQILGNLLKDINIDGDTFDLGDVERNCKVKRNSVRNAKLSCSDYDLDSIEDDCKAKFYNYETMEGSIDCYGFDLSVIESNCKAKMTSHTKGKVDCGVNIFMNLCQI